MANVLNRTTLAYLLSVNTPDYPTESWVINPDMSAVSAVAAKYWKLTGDVVSEMSQGEKDTVDAACLPDCRAAKCAAIDARTDELISVGFVFATKTFSLSANAQAKMMGITQIRDDENLTYPIKWNTIDDTDTHSITDSAMMLSFYLTGVGTYRSHLDGGTTLKDSVRAATTIAAVDAVTDTR